ncbi:unnamed protein product [Acidocella sp. C78]|uniref:halocarboxylic acid dehydrogenase DehI family protein n=1 Tax=Acidocella sp. C78 TaxID=1671486 RepID=UPI00191BB9FA|nr:halocarboxylic acid dehydrogenase DehI family protein [Acidocella sp. C78]CAG4906893.1 unnamed protein product [Acidocella sp. C78]
MTTLERHLPTPIPAIHPLAEYLADGERKAFYTAMKTALQVPWMGVVTMAYAHYPHFFRHLWQGIEPIVTSAGFVGECRELRALAEGEAARLAPAGLRGTLDAAGYAPAEIASIRDMIEIFSHGNYPYLLIATLVRLLLEGGAMAPDAAVDAVPFTGRHAPDVACPFVLMEAHHAEPTTRAVYEDVKATLGLPFVNTDYRALARWPSYFAAAWGGIRPLVATPAYEAACRRVHDDALARVRHRVPNPAGLDAEGLRAAALRDAPLDEMQAVARLFQWLLPGLVLNVALFDLQLR